MAKAKKTTVEKRSRGRPRSSMTPENCAAVIRAVKMGLHPDRAAEAAGVSRSTMRAHRRRNEGFATQIKEAEAFAEQDALGKIIKHSDSQWTAAAWLLERRFPERWARRDPDRVVAAKEIAKAGPKPAEAPQDLAMPLAQALDIAQKAVAHAKKAKPSGS
jgi:transposase